MARLQGFRLVNIHANNNTIIYANEHFNIEGRNTLIDMKNGGGKTLAVQMLFQTILPNTYFEKQKNILRLFDDVSNGSCIHVVSHFNTENTQFKNLYLGFAATSQLVINDETSEVSNAGIKYINYIIEGNNIETESLTIDTLPLCKDDGDNIKPATYKEINDFLHSRKNNEKNGRFYNIKIYTKFERTKYYRDLKKFGINSEVFEFLESINRDENYIKHFFETECSKPKDLFMKFILENTQKALNAKDVILNIDNTDKSENLSKSLYESASILNKLNKIYKDKAQFTNLKEQISNNINFVKSKSLIISEYHDHLKEYPKQVSLLSNLILSEKQKKENIESDKVMLDKELYDINSAIKSIEFYLLLNEKNRLERICTEKESILAECNGKISMFCDEKLQCEAINLTVDYRIHQQEKVEIDEQIEKLTAENYDEKIKLAKYANAINDIVQKASEKLNFDIVKNIRDAKITTENHSKLNQDCGKIAFELKQNGKELILQKDIKYKLKKELSDLLKELETFPNFSGSMLDLDEHNELKKEYLRVNNSIISTKSALDDTKNELNNSEKEIAVVQNDIAHNKKLLDDNKSILDEFNKSLIKILSKTYAQEHTLKETKAKMNTTIEEINLKLNQLTDEGESLKEEISILSHYGFLRTKEKYDALSILNNDLKYAKFGSEILQELNLSKPELVDEILSKFPAFPECLVVSDEDYLKISGGKKTLSVTVLNELFVIIKASFIHNIDACEFNQIFLASRDKLYYSKLLDSEVAIETRRNRKLITEKLHRAKSDEKSDINSKIDLITTHISKYSDEFIENQKNLVLEIDNNLKGFELQRIKFSNSIQNNELTIDNSYNLLKKLDDEKLLLEKKTELLSKKAVINNRISETRISITNLDSKKSDLEYSSNENKNNLEIVSKEIATLNELCQKLKKELSEYQYYKNEVKNHIVSETLADSELDITVLFGKFSVAKKQFLKADNYNIDDLYKKQETLHSYMDGCKINYVFTNLNFEDIYKRGILTKIASTYIVELMSKIDSFTAMSKGLTDEKTKSEVKFQIKLDELNKKKSEITIYFEHYKEISSDELCKDFETQMKKSSEVKVNIDENSKLLDSCKRNLIDLDKEISNFKGFCDFHKLDYKTATKADGKMLYIAVSSKNNDLERNYDLAINSINFESKKTLSSINKLNIQEQLKTSLKDCLGEKINFDNIFGRINQLENYIENTDIMLSNLETSIAGIGKIDDEIARQILRTITEILDEIQRIPEYSKMKYGSYFKESLKINLNTEGGCRWNDTIILSNIKTYIFDIANNIETDSLTQKDIKGKLNMNKMISLAVDFNRLNIQILKIDDENSKYYNWGTLIASSGESYVTYVMFVATMIKYFNSVTITNNKMKSDIFIFLDNPFASASNTMLWEPVKRFLDKCNAQLLCTSHNPPSSAQILFDKHIIIEQARNSSGQSVNIIRNQKTESKEIMQMNLFDHQEI